MFHSCIDKDIQILFFWHFCILDWFLATYLLAVDGFSRINFPRRIMISNKVVCYLTGIYRYTEFYSKLSSFEGTGILGALGTFIISLSPLYIHGLLNFCCTSWLPWILYRPFWDLRISSSPLWCFSILFLYIPKLLKHFLFFR